MAKINTQNNTLVGAVKSSSTTQTVNVDPVQALFNNLYATKDQGKQAVILNDPKNASLLNAKTKGGYTILHLAAYHGREDITGLLLKTLGVRIDETDPWGRTAFDLASYNGKDDAARLLLEFKMRDNNLLFNGIGSFVAREGNFEANNLLKLTAPLITKIANEDLSKLNPIACKLLAKTYASSNNNSINISKLAKDLGEELSKVIDNSPVIRTILSQASESNGNIFMGSLKGVERVAAGYYYYKSDNIHIDNSNEKSVKFLTEIIVHEIVHKVIHHLFKNWCLPFAKGEDHKFAPIAKAMDEELHQVELYIDKAEQAGFQATPSSIRTELIVEKTWLQRMTNGFYKESEFSTELFAWLTQQLAYNILYKDTEGSIVCRQTNTSSVFAKIVWNYLWENIIKALNRDTSQILEPMPQDLGYDAPIPKASSDIAKRAKELVKGEFTIACFEEGAAGELAFQALSEKVQGQFINKLFLTLDETTKPLLVKHAGNIINGLTSNGNNLFAEKLFTLEDNVLNPILEANSKAVFEYLPFEKLQLFIDKVFALKPASLVAFLEEKSVALFKKTSDGHYFTNKLFKLPADILQSILSKNENIVELIRINPFLIDIKLNHLDKDVLKALLTSYAEKIRTTIEQSNLNPGEDPEPEGEDNDSAEPPVLTKKDILRIFDVLVYRTLDSGPEQEEVALITNPDETITPTTVDYIGEVEVGELHAIL